MDDVLTAGGKWASFLAEWAIPEELLACAPESPYFFDPAVFSASADQAVERGEDSPSDTAARDALPPGGGVLDVGVGAGAACLRLADRAALIVGVDVNADLLKIFQMRAQSSGVRVETFNGAWPEIAPQIPSADIVVCHHVFYNVANLDAFATALDNHARRRVVVELTAEHPMAWMRPYWQALHGLSQPVRPVADDAVDLLKAMGFDVRQFRWRRPIQMIGETAESSLARIARRLCIGPERYEELRNVLENSPPPLEREVVTLWWEHRP